MRTSFLMLVLAVCCADGALAQNSADPSKAAIQPTTQIGVKKAKPRMICTTEETTGSRFSKKVCRPAGFNAADEQIRRDVQAAQVGRPLG